MGFTGVGGRLSHLGCESTDAIPGRNAYISKRESKKVCKVGALLAWGLQLVDHATAMLSERRAQLQVPLVLQS